MLKRNLRTISIGFLILALIVSALFAAVPSTTKAEQLPDNMPAPISQSTTQLAEPTLFQDNFDDNQFDENLWEKIEVDGGTVDEKNGRLQVTIPSHDYNLTKEGYWGNYSQAGYMTKCTFGTRTMQGFEATVNVVELDSVMEVSLMVSDQKITNLDPINASNWYRILKIKDTHYPDRHLAMVERRINGGPVSVIMEGPWFFSTGQLKINISSDVISFYENGILRYTESYALATNSCYVSIFTSSLGCFFGTDSFDDFAAYPVNVEGEPSSISISTESLSATAGSAVNVLGTLLDSNNIPLKNETVVLSYTFPGAGSWIPISSGLTDIQGNYNIQWMNSASGTFTLKTQWSGDTNHLGVSNTTTLSFLPIKNRQLFLLESNSTVDALAFNNETSTLSFNVTGPSGTTGYVKTTISKSMLNNSETLQVYLDGKQLNYSVSALGDFWVFSFNYYHSTH
ncbi:MAG TPA: hypothetical protein DGG95_06760 [Cytophagales bacterium]|nr:hypothetical protein [Cytophagales bacterium]